MEVERLHTRGLVTINHEQLQELHHVKVLLRAHGEPPGTYQIARENDIEIIDATCPVVLQLQRRIKRQYDNNPQAQIVIFGKNGHAEVLGLVGQTASHAVVVEKLDDVKHLDFNRDIYLYSQTTKVWTNFIISSNIYRNIFHNRQHSKVLIPFADKLPTACRTSQVLQRAMTWCCLSVAGKVQTGKFCLRNVAV